MKTFLKTFLSLIIAIVITSCSSEDLAIQNPPTVDFNFSIADSRAPAIVTFNSVATNTTTYFWDFGDGTVSSLMNPQHTYLKGGNYNVKLTVTGLGGTKTVTKPITINNAISKIKITRIDIISIPLMNGILNWDTATDKPDIYIRLFDEKGNSPPKFGTIFNFIPSITSTYSITFTSPIVSTDLLNSVLKVQVWDDDSDNTFDLNGDDKIGEVPFTIRNYITGANRFPSMVSESSNGTLVTMYMTWE